jgi:hypothetical protein
MTLMIQFADTLPVCGTSANPQTEFSQTGNIPHSSELAGLRRALRKSRNGSVCGFHTLRKECEPANPLTQEPPCRGTCGCRAPALFANIRIDPLSTVR